jgi:ketosteroid isomerase-like protein
MPIEREMTDEERALLEQMTRSSWGDAGDDYRAADVDGMVQMYAPDCISMPANHQALFGHDELRAWYAKRTGGNYDMNVEARADSVDIVGDIAVVVGIFRVTRRPEEGVAGLDHGGRYLTIMRRIDGEWKLWRDVDTPSPDADVFYDKQPRGW